MQWLLRSPAVTRRTFRQSVHGQISAKPTTFLLLRLDGISKYLYSFQGQSVPLARVQALHGRDDTGAWHTAGAKEYPPSLCRAIACAIKDSVDDRRGVDGERVVAGGVGSGLGVGAPSVDDDGGVGAVDDCWREYGHFYQQLDMYDPACASNVMGADCALFNH